ncbi:unnamed protein product [Caenorhabditis auriculariae]|uniref:SHSP domain-containing protein n=1 Tax=Caenorhabditis auriculariae TaxID=2777116 RepID=A0A8S1HB68_9PELO|nr:unnamed protein product [Caenorhabditis auriculariae]
MSLFPYRDSIVNPYWLNSNQLDINNGEVINDDKQFAVKLDVSHFRPEELNVQLNGRQLTIEGKHEFRGDHGMSQRSFLRSFLVPDDVDINAVHSELSNDGRLAIEAPKTAFSADRAISFQKH